MSNKALWAGALLAAVLFLSTGAYGDPPATYDLRDEERSTSVKAQDGGTCWAHGTMAAIESNLLTTGNWADAGEAGQPDLAEYHLDWWNGFNWHNNDDTTPAQQVGNGLQVHQGGDYLVSTAYIARLEGAVRNIDGQSYLAPPPLRNDPSYHHYYVRDVEWYTAGADGNDITNINVIKNAVMTYGAIGTAYYSSGYGSTNHYQPEDTTQEPDHAVAIVGWDDNHVFDGAPGNGGWLVKNSWGDGWNGDGHLWISYYDKHAGHQPQMGAVSFRNVEPNGFSGVYSHDYHGWRDTLGNVSSAFNAFTADADDPLSAVSFYTATDGVEYTVTVYDTFSNGQLSEQLATETGTIAVTGFHTIDLDSLVPLTDGDDFYILLVLDKGGHAIDRTSVVPVLLGEPAVTDGSVVSDADAGESYYLDGVTWMDLHELGLYGPDVGRDVTGSANFCIKGLTVPEPATVALMAMGLIALVRRRR